MTWDTNPSDPVRRHGPGWDDNPTEQQNKTKSGWFALLEKVAQHNGNGNLTVTVSPHMRTNVNFGGSGELSESVLIRNARNAYLSGLGLPTAQAFQTVSSLVNFTGVGDLENALNDGLSVVAGRGVGALFSGGGAMVPDVSGGRPLVDGLYADVIGRYLIPAYFTSEGQLVAMAGNIITALASLIGSGALSAGTSQIYPAMVALAGSGSLSAQVFASYQTLVNLLGSGTLSAPAFASYLSSLGVSGAGALTVLLMQSYAQAPAIGGTGTITAAVYQIYNIAALLTSAGTLSATAILFALQVAAALTGNGTLSATAIDGSGPAMSTLTDNFATQDNVKWTYLAGASVTAQGNAKIITGTSNVTITSNTRYTLKNSSAEVCILQTADHGGGTLGQVLAQMLTIDSNGNGWSIWTYSTFLVLREITTAGGTSDVNITYDPVNHKFWRVRESGGNILWDTSPDGNTWTNQRTKAADPTIAIGQMQAQLLGWWTGTGSAGAILFDNFNLPTLTKFTSPAFTGSGAQSAIMFKTFTETNTARSGQAVPTGTTGCWVTLAGAGGGAAGGNSGGSGGSGGGGGGGGKISRVFIPVASLGGTYTVGVGAVGGGGAANANGNAGGAATFSSGSISLSAGGGGAGLLGTGAGGAGGAGGTCSAAGISVTSNNGTAGGNGGFNGGGTAGTNNATGSGAGGGGGAHAALFTTQTGGKGGNSSTVTGGAGGVSNANGTQPPDATAGNGGGGGGGGGSNGSSGTSGGGANAGAYGGGGGGGGGGTSGTKTGGNGGSAYTLIEWV